METLLLHTCCAPCSAAVIEWLLNNDIRPVLFFYNPNIYPLEEYEIRQNELKRYAAESNIEFIAGDYLHSSWTENIKGLENQPERGARCAECFKMRLLATADTASRKGIARIATTLTSSRWKSYEQVSRAGHLAAASFPDVTFFDKDWKKNGLSERRSVLLKENGFYNQQYCGCEFSIGLKRLS
ncbi:MAG: epoxyqueuosine reductase QueH [Dysgonamonadaceae bacterium]|jgi:predicted adenine nucleotide alpha hydrolase (AANH) superfamily ATPase|nr:epoxyqueuosine reductase QueH [Dysgonamonadaceae bacterium]